MDKPLISIEDFRKRQENQRVQRQYEALGKEGTIENFFDPDFGLDKEYAVDPQPQAQPQPQPQGSFRMGGVDYKYLNGQWTALKADGTPMTPGEMFRHTNEMTRKPGQITGKPLISKR